MAIVEITSTVDGKPAEYQNYTINTFSSWRALQKAALQINKNKPNTDVDKSNAAFENYVNSKIQSGDTDYYGLFGKHPVSYEDAMKRTNFVYWDEYKRIKEKVEKKVREELQKSSEAEAMKSKLVFNDKQIGEFVFAKAAMSLQPEIFYYSPSQNREVNVETEAIDKIDDKMYLQSDKSLVVFAFKVEKEDGEEIFVEIVGDGEESLKAASDLGIVSCSSNNKKVYLYNEKKPRVFNAVKVVIALTGGGWENWKNDFYTGITAGVIVEVMESLGYAVAVQVVVGGGRCNACGATLTFKGQQTIGRRFFIFDAKSLDSQLDLDGLLYTVADPSFHNVKWIALINSFFNFYDDQITIGNNWISSGNDTGANPIRTWHGITESDLVNPIGMYIKRSDIKKGNTNLIHFYVHRVHDENDVVRQVTDLVLTCENKNREALKKYSNYDFGLDD